jgi:hypothetical protein
MKFEAAPMGTSTFSIYISAHAIGDFNNDGRLDFAFGNDEYLITVLLGNGDGTFGAKVTSTDFQYGGFYNMATADFNNDHWLDLLFTETRYGYVFILLGNGDGTFSKKTLLRLGHEIIPYGIVVTDFNADRYLDIVLTISSRDNIVIFLGKGDGNFRTQITLATGLGSHPAGVTVADFNNDRYQDIAVVGFGRGNIGIFLGSGNESPFQLAVGDLNSDGFVDIVVSFYDHQFIAIMYGDGTGSMNDAIPFPVGAPWRRQPIFVDDFDGDGYLDVGFGKTNQTMAFLAGNANGSFHLQSAFVIRSTSQFYAFDLADLNGDGYKDILYMSSRSNSHEIFLRTCQ